MTSWSGLAHAFDWDHYGLFDEEWSSIPTQIGRSLARLDGDDHWSYSIYVVPTPLDFREIDFSRFPEEYLQSAGTSGSMMVEVRRRESDGALRQYAIGRDADEDGVREITWPSDDPEKPHRLVVPAVESFTAEEALPIYERYAADQTVPDGFLLRRLDL